jgi:hypothetical protein
MGAEAASPAASRLATKFQLKAAKPPRSQVRADAFSGRKFISLEQKAEPAMRNALKGGATIGRAPELPQNSP